MVIIASRNVRLLLGQFLLKHRAALADMHPSSFTDLSGHVIAAWACRSSRPRGRFRPEWFNIPWKGIY